MSVRVDGTEGYEPVSQGESDSRQGVFRGRWIVSDSMGHVEESEHKLNTIWLLVGHFSMCSYMLACDHEGYKSNNRSNVIYS
jgi:hypothetical protein